MGKIQEYTRLIYGKPAAQMAPTKTLMKRITRREPSRLGMS